MSLQAHHRILIFSEKYYIMNISLDLDRKEENGSFDKVLYILVNAPNITYKILYIHIDKKKLIMIEIPGL